MSSLRSNEGYLYMHNPGPMLPALVLQQAGLPAAAGRGTFEAPTYTCNHCKFVVVMNPDRQRERAYCRACDHQICDACGATRANGERCRTWSQKVDEYLENIARAEQVEAPTSPIILV